MTYSLKAVSGYLGVPADTVRKWELRHAVVSPKRLANGYRVYTEEDLQRLLRFAESRREGLPAPQARRKAAAAPSMAAPAGEVKAAVSAVLRFDRRALSRLYRRHARRGGEAASFSRLWLPVLAEIGRQAHEEGGLWIAAEHFASAFLRESLLSSFKCSAKGRSRLVLAAPAGDRHELGMLAAACALDERGVPCVYLGPDLPLESLCAALKRLRAGGLSLTLTARRPRAEVRALLRALRRDFPGLEIFVCGQESLRHANLIRESGARFLGTDLERGLAAVAAALGGKPR